MGIISFEGSWGIRLSREMKLRENSIARRPLISGQLSRRESADGARDPMGISSRQDSIRVAAREVRGVRTLFRRPFARARPTAGEVKWIVHY